MRGAVDVAIVGGGPAGAVLAALVARGGRSVAVLERAPTYRWRACGVFSSPASATVLRAIGLDEATLRRIARPVPAMRVETSRGTTFRLTYGDDGSLTAPAVGFDRGGLDPALLDLARSAGAEVRMGATVTSVEPGRLVVRVGDRSEELRARIIVGADGIRSVVARAFGVARPARLAPRVGLTFHVAEPGADEPRDARIITFEDGYVGLAPVPGGRVNVGIVLGRSWAGRLRANGAEATVATVLAAVPKAGDDPIDWRNPRPCDAIEGAAPLGHRVASRHGPGWLLIGDAAGFLDPFTGEGLHRAVVSARLAAVAIARLLDGDGDGLVGYDRAMIARFRSKDAVSLIVQALVARAGVFDHVARRLATRDRVRETMGLVMGDLVPASRAVDPRFVADLLR